MKRIVEICLGALLVAGLLFAVVWASVCDRAADREKLCRGIKLSVLDSATNKFIDRKGLKAIMDRDFGGYVNRPVDSINLWKAENTLRQQKCLKTSRAYITPDCIFHIDIRQRTPLYKLKSRRRISYIDREGVKMTVNVDWCDGIPSVWAEGETDDLWNLRTASLFTEFRRSGVLDGLRDSIWCDRSGDVYMKRKSGDEIYMLGQPVRIKEKAEGVSIYENRIKPSRTAENSYTSVDFKNKGQIVCK